MSELSITGLKKLSTAAIIKQLPITIVSGKKQLFKLVAVTADQPSTPPVQTPTGNAKTFDQQVDELLASRGENRGDNVHVANAEATIRAQAPSTPKDTPTDQTPTAPVDTSDIKLYRSPQQVDKYVDQYPEFKILQQPTGKWEAEWTNFDELKKMCEDAKSKGETPQIIWYYNINRDNGGASAGGAQTPEQYTAQLNKMLTAMTTQCIVVVEPDSIPLNIHTDLVIQAARAYKKAGHLVYLDIGHPGWFDAATAASKLLDASIQEFDGYSINVSNYRKTEECISWRHKIKYLLKQKGVTNKTGLIDTSRNGNGPQGSEWQNPAGTKIGTAPDMSKGQLWLKTPAESDGNNFTGGQQWPNAGEFSVKLAQNLISGNW